MPCPISQSIDRYLSSLDRDAAAEEREWDAELASLEEPVQVADWEDREEAHEVTVEGIMDGTVEPPRRVV